MFGWIKWLFGMQKQPKKYEWNKTALMSMSKRALDEHAEKWDVKLDRRYRKSEMILKFREELKRKGLI